MVEKRNEVYDLIIKKSRRDSRMNVRLDEEFNSLEIERDDMTFIVNFDEEKQRFNVYLDRVKIKDIYVFWQDSDSIKEHYGNYGVHMKSNLIVNNILTLIRECPEQKKLVKLTNKFIKTLDVVKDCNKSLLKDLIEKYL